MNYSIALTEDKKINQTTFIQKIKSLNEKIDLLFVAANGDECLAALKGLPLNKLPQVIFMDLEMPKLNGIETIGMAKAIYPQIHFIVLTVFDDDEKIFEAIKAGASGYLLKHESAETILDALKNVIDIGGAPMSPVIARKALSLLSNSNRTGNHINQLPENISERETEILKHLISGWDAKRIGDQLQISPLTVRKHIGNIYSKLHVSSKAEVISMAHKNKWV